MIFVGLFIGGVVGAALGYFICRSQLGAVASAHQARTTSLNEQLDLERRHVDALERERDQLRERVAVLDVTIRNEQTRLAELRENDQRLVAEFDRLSKAALHESGKQLLQNAEHTFKLAQQEAKGELDQQRVRIEHLVKPVQENLAKLEAHIQTTEQARKEEYGGLFQQMRAVAETNQRVEEEAKQLKNVLRSSGSKRGRWGEVQLRRVVELAGMLEHCDFTEQSFASIEGEAGREAGRADLIVWLQNSQQIAVDAKVPYDAYERAQTTDDPVLQKQQLSEHALLFRKHVDALAGRKYWEKYQPSCGFAVMFVPGEALLDAALVHDSALWEHAAERNVLLATPSTLIAMLRMAALGWRQQEQAKNAEEIVKVGQELYKRLRTAGTHLEKMGRGLSSAVGAYNDYVGSMTSRVVPSARNLASLGVGDAEFPSADEITDGPRPIREGIFIDEQVAIEASDAV